MDKEELKKKIVEIVSNDEESVKLLEIVEDTYKEPEEPVDEFKGKYEELLQKYKERFLESETKVEEPEKEDEIEEKEIIDIKEI